MDQKITAVIIDDIELARISLRADIEDHCPNIDIIGEADGVVAGAKLLKQAAPDIAFLDIEMKDGDGFDVLDIIPQLQTKIIFVTGSSEYAIRAFRYSAVDYLTKPVDADELIEAVEKATQVRTNSAEQMSILKSSYQNTNEPQRKIALHTAEQIMLAEIKDIVRLESMGNYSQFYFADGSKVLITKTLKTYDSLLSQQGFERVHQSHLVNMEYVKAYVKTEGGYLSMKDDSIVPVSVRKKAHVMSLLS